MEKDAHISILSIICDILKSAGIIVLAAYLFFNSIFGIVIVIPFGLYSVYKIARRVGERQKSMYIVQFRDALSCMLTTMEAGGTPESSISSVIRDLSIMHGKDCRLVKEYTQIDRKLKLSENIEDAFEEFAENVRVREISNFVEIFITAKRSGGNILELIRAALNDLYIKLETTREVEGIIASAAMEALVMKSMPIFILLYLRIFSGSFLDPLYNTIIGKIVMFFACVIYLLLSEYCERLVVKAGKG